MCEKSWRFPFIEVFGHKCGSINLTVGTTGAIGSSGFVETAALEGLSDQLKFI